MFFETIAPLLAKHRGVLAPDYPGYGRSQALPGTPSIAIYAEAMMEVLQQSPLRAPFDLLGFHTGCLVAVEMALTYGADIGRLVLVDVPYFDAKKRAELMAGEMAPDGFRAAFSYPNEERFAALTNDCLVIATQSSLLEPSRAAAAAIKRCELLELPEVTAPALENGAAPIAAASMKFLDEER
jgi:pimeloyl-ACP methyl ester carboxylesterase